MQKIVRSAAGVAAVLALTLTGCGGTTTSAPSTVTVYITSTPANTETATTTTRSNASLKAAMQDWSNRSNLHLKTAVDALISVSNCSSSPAADVQCMRDGCTTAHKAITIDLKADMPSPEPRLTEAINSMIDDFDKGMHICTNLPDNPTTTQIAQFESYIDESLAHLETAKSIRDEDLADP